MSNLISLCIDSLTALFEIPIFPEVLGALVLLAFVICLIQFIFKAVI